jgi:hypothetical protein
MGRMAYGWALNLTSTATPVGCYARCRSRRPASVGVCLAIAAAHFASFTRAIDARLRPGAPARLAAPSAGAVLSAGAMLVFFARAIGAWRRRGATARTVIGVAAAADFAARVLVGAVAIRTAADDRRTGRRAPYGLTARRGGGGAHTGFAGVVLGSVGLAVTAAHGSLASRVARAIEAAGLRHAVAGAHASRGVAIRSTKLAFRAVCVRRAAFSRRG